MTGEDAAPAAGHPGDAEFEDRREPAGRDAERLVLRLDAYEGPIDLLLEQAREQKVDLTQISILALAEQYLAFVEQARRLSLDLAADYLVMAAWLAYLKSRLLLPEDGVEDEPTGEELAAALRFQLQRLEAMRGVAARLMERPRLGTDVFARGTTDAWTAIRVPTQVDTLYDLLKAYGSLRRRKDVAEGRLSIEASALYTTDDALAWVTRLLGGRRGWIQLAHLVPATAADPLIRRSALAATLTATLELAKSGRIDVRQDGTFGPIYLRSLPSPS